MKIASEEVNTTNRLTSNGSKRHKEVEANLYVLQSMQLFGAFQSEAQTVVRWRVLEAAQEVEWVGW